MATTNRAITNPAMMNAFNAAVEEYRRAYPNHEVTVLATHRPPTEQHHLYKQGREWEGGAWVLMDPMKRMTDVDGLAKRGAINMIPSRGVDFVITMFGKVVWDATEYTPFGEILEKHGLWWGGRSNEFPDVDHCELRL